MFSDVSVILFNTVTGLHARVIETSTIGDLDLEMLH